MVIVYGCIFHIHRNILELLGWGQTISAICLHTAPIPEEIVTVTHKALVLALIRQLRLSIILLKVVIAVSAITPKLVHYLLVEVEEDFDLLRLKTVLVEELVISNTLAHFMDPVYIFDFVAVLSVDLNDTIH